MNEIIENIMKKYDLSYEGKGEGEKMTIDEYYKKVTYKITHMSDRQLMFDLMRAGWKGDMSYYTFNWRAGRRDQWRQRYRVMRGTVKEQ